MNVLNLFRRMIAHSVMGWLVIILLATIVAIPPVFIFISKSAAEWVSIGGMLLAMNWCIGCVLWDHFVVSRRSH